MRIDEGGAYANVVVPAALAASELSRRDRAFVTELVYGVTRRRRALDWVIDAFLVRPPPPPARAALRLGAYQLTELAIAPHAAVSATVDAAPRRFRGLVNAVLRRVAAVHARPGTGDVGGAGARVRPLRPQARGRRGPDAVAGAGAGVRPLRPQTRRRRAASTDGVAVAGAGAAMDWPDEPTRLSYPDWIVERLTDDLGAADATTALEAMNGPAPVHRRADGYVQDLSAQLVVDSIAVSPGDLAADLCAAPGGKATALAARGARVIAADSHIGRIGRLMRNRRALGAESLFPVIADGRRPPLRPGRFDVVLVDAPCSGLGALRRRPDARWRIQPGAVQRLARLQAELLRAAAPLLRPGGLLVYSVCTLTAAETLTVAEQVPGVSGRGADLEPAGPLPAPWRPHGDGGMVLPDAERDGMAMFCWLRR